jgi:plastocyanin
MAALSRPLPARSFGWQTLLYWAALANLAALALMTVAMRDTLALALGMILLVGLGLWRLRGHWLGIVILGLLFADLTAYTVTGAVSNIVFHQGLRSLVIPSWLASVSLAGIAAAIAVGVQRRRPQARSDTASIVAASALALFAGTLVVGILSGSSGSQQVGQPDIALLTRSMVYSETELEAEAGEITVSLANEDLFWHTFTIDALGLDLQVPIGAERQTTFTAAPGTYTFYCAIPGHEILGMHGTLTVR